MSSIKDSLDVALLDLEFLDELELATNLIIAATQSSGPLPPCQIDRILGLTPKTNAPDRQQGER